MSSTQTGVVASSSTHIQNNITNVHINYTSLYIVGSIFSNTIYCQYQKCIT